MITDEIEICQQVIPVILDSTSIKKADKAISEKNYYTLMILTEVPTTVT